MNKFSILICIGSMCCIGLLNAQNSKPSSRHQPANAVTPKGSSVVRYEVKTDLKQTEDDVKAVFPKELGNQSIALLPDSKTQTLMISFDTAKVELTEIKMRLSPRALVLIPATVEAKKDTTTQPTPPPAPVQTSAPAPAKPAPKYKPEIDEFLNIEDTTIFGSRFKRCNMQEIHPSRINYYNLIQTIYDLNVILKSVERNINPSRIAEVVKSYGGSPEDAKAFLLKSAKSDLAKAIEYSKKITQFQNDFEYISESQKNYYNSLINKLNDFANLIDIE